ncbi:hypothetical protein SMICM17S_11538 [Streptomyces microflavus]
MTGRLPRTRASSRRSWASGPSSPAWPRVLDQPVELLAGEDGLHLVLRFDAEDPPADRAGAQRGGDRTADQGEADQAGAEPERGALRGGHREVLGSLADDQVRGDHEGERQREAERVDEPLGSPVAVRGPASSWASAGSASIPTTSEVMVMPSWVPESWKESSRRASTTVRARRSPSAAARSASGRSTVTSPRFGCHEESVGEDEEEGRREEQQGGGHEAAASGEGWRRYYRTIRPLLEGVTPWVAGRPRGPRGGEPWNGRGGAHGAPPSTRVDNAAVCGAGAPPVRGCRRPWRTGTRRGRAGSGRRGWPAPWPCRAGCRGRACWCRR